MINKNKDLNLEDFVDKLLEEKNLPKDLDQDIITEMKMDLLKRADNRINAVIVANLPEDKLEEFSSLLDQDDSLKVQTFLEDNIPDLLELIASELLDFRQTYLR